ncbi:nuclear transport factor 2 family protein [Streptomyces sp. TS71-3]|uniref:nuclear transport factor 2 family protein n=1 Tax=Streptomyces sp. TS71-3 TaxID=2733862 RepID=UPI001B11D66F|nr:nuclear transport factor 2 family protein [Streptomyces sp. TS71-3]GHJ38630.1 hypothetical protein Sm713_42390 [Streptomyces sp. TS71-3]
MSSPHRFRLRALVTVLPALALVGLMGCTDAAGGTGAAGAAATSAGRLTDGRDEQGHRYREVPENGAPQVDVVVRPDAEDGWDLTLSVRHFRFTPARDPGRPAAVGRGGAQLYLDGRRLTLLHGPGYHLPSRLLSRGTHEVTARLYADDHTVWAVHGKPVESTAPVTASDATPDASAGPGAGVPSGGAAAASGGASAGGGPAAPPASAGPVPADRGTAP